jgi:hypothetical protein
MGFEVAKELIVAPAVPIDAKLLKREFDETS